MLGRSFAQVNKADLSNKIWLTRLMLAVLQDYFIHVEYHFPLRARVLRFFIFVFIARNLYCTGMLFLMYIIRLQLGELDSS